MGGVKRSIFTSTESKPIYETGYLLGIEWSLIYDFSICWEFMYTSRGGILEDKIIGGYYVRDAYLQDIQCQIRSFELPILLKYSIPVRDNMEIQLIMGSALSIGVRDKSTFENKEFLYEVTDGEDWRHLTYDYEYAFEQSGPLPYVVDNSGMVFYTGVSFRWSFFIADIRYAHDFFDIEAIRSTNLGEKSHAVLINLGFHYQD